MGWVQQVGWGQVQQVRLGWVELSPTGGVGWGQVRQVRLGQLGFDGSGWVGSSQTGGSGWGLNRGQFSEREGDIKTHP